MKSSLRSIFVHISIFFAIHTLVVGCKSSINQAPAPTSDPTSQEKAQPCSVIVDLASAEGKSLNSATTQKSLLDRGWSLNDPRSPNQFKLQIVGLTYGSRAPRFCDPSYSYEFYCGAELHLVSINHPDLIPPRRIYSASDYRCAQPGSANDIACKTMGYWLSAYDFGVCQ